MIRVSEIQAIDSLAAIRPHWATLLQQTPGASFFQSLEWLEVYWRHFAGGQKLRTLVVSDADKPIGILPLVIRRERSKVGPFNVLTYPLDDWGAFYGPIGPDAALILSAAFEHIRSTPRDWDFIELRGQGAPGTSADENLAAMRSSGLPAYQSLYDRTAVVDFDGSWDAYWAARRGPWRRRFRRAEKMLSQQGEITFVRHRPNSAAEGDGDPRWDLYDACEELAQQSWQAGSDDGTTLSHDSVRPFLREMHAVASAAGAADISLLMIAGQPAAYIYGYHYQGYAYGLRRGYDARFKQGAGTVLLARVLRDGFSRGDRVYDMGPGSFETKRHFATRKIPIWRLSHIPRTSPRLWMLRLRRWWQARAAAD